MINVINSLYSPYSSPIPHFEWYSKELSWDSILNGDTSQQTNNKIVFVVHENKKKKLFSSSIDAARSGDKYETSSTNVGYSKYMKLKIRSVGFSDYGCYRCVAKNSLGETDGLIKLEGNISILVCEPREIHLFVHLFHLFNE